MWLWNTFLFDFDLRTMVSYIIRVHNRFCSSLVCLAEGQSKSLNAASTRATVMVCLREGRTRLAVHACLCELYIHIDNLTTFSFERFDLGTNSILRRACDQF